MNYDKVQTIIDQAVREVNAKRESQIVERLNALGFQFESTEKLREFAKQRMTMCSFEEKPYYRELYVDFGKPEQMLVASWYNTTEPDFSDPTNFKIIAGVRP